MAKVYLIGGTPRAGKTTLTMRFLKEHPIMAASTDAIRYTLRRVIRELDEPDLFHLGKYTSNDPERRAYLKSNPLDVVDVQNKESAVVWRSVVNFINSNLEDGFDVLIEGIAVLPELVAQLECEYSAIFLGNQSEQHFQTILNSARSNENDWMHDLEDETIEAFATFNQAFSKYIEQEASNHGMTYVEVRDDNFDTDMNTALNSLLN
jgi:2-phosphoglycerate kinase